MIIFNPRIGKIFVYKNVQNLKKKFFVSPANSSLVGILIIISDITDIFAIKHRKEPYWKRRGIIRLLTA